ncbi:MAG TPA: glutathione S-transferase [Burkholderiales bacterium]|nr:glutathione S-transferase [Burkholderiales bacterium]
MLKLWGRTNSVNVKKALWCLGELGIPYERLDAGMAFGVVNTPEYRRMNPNGRVPTIEDDGFVLWESHSIVRYLCAKHSMGKLCPSDLRVRADAERWMDWAFTFQNAMRDVFWGLIRTPPDKRDQKAIDAGVKASHELAGMLDGVLAGRPFVAGDAFTMGDIPIGCEVQRYLRVPIERPSRPHLEAWFERLRQRPPFVKHVDLPLT